MKKLADVEQIDSIIATALTKQSGLENERIINAHSIRGPELSKAISDTVQLSYELEDVAIIFEVQATSDLSITEEDEDGLLSFNSAKIDITIYGNESFQMATMLKARLESEKSKYDLLEEGLHLNTVGSLSEISEILNNTVWPRVSFDINVDFCLLVSKIDDFADFKDVTITTQTIDSLQ